MLEFYALHGLKSWRVVFFKIKNTNKQIILACQRFPVFISFLFSFVVVHSVRKKVHPQLTPTIILDLAMTTTFPSNN